MIEAEVNFSLVCSQCDFKLVQNSVFCSNCGYPENGTVKEKSIFVTKKRQHQHAADLAESKIKKARNTLFVIAGINIVVGVWLFMTDNDIAVLTSQFILGIIYLLLGYWSSKKPIISLLMGLLVYITTIIISGIFDPSTIFKGVLWKVIIIAFIGKGLISASSNKGVK